MADVIENREDMGLDTALPHLVEELKITPRQITAVAKLLGEGNTIPFIARYRKEMHGNLDEVQISKIQERLTYYKELEDRRSTILNSIEEQGKLTDELKSKILACQSKTALEDLYLPYKPKRRTRAMVAREKGLEPLAKLILAQLHAVSADDVARAKDNQEITESSGQPISLAEAATLFIDKEKGVADAESALAGAKDIVAELISENAEVRGMVRKAYEKTAKVVSSVVEPKPAEPTKFEQYYDFSEPLAEIPSHRFLAIRRGQTEGVLRVKLSCESAPLLEKIREMYSLDKASPFADALGEAIDDGYKRLIAPSVEVDVTVEQKMKADRAAVEVFAENLRNLLLAAPLGEQKIIGIDPGIRTGCKCVALDATGKFLENCVIYIQRGAQEMIEAKVNICKLVAKYRPYAIAVGNGTGGRETEAFVRAVLKEAGASQIMVISVSEAGASVYSASEVAREEFPDLDLTVRGAISIGRRLQDPLAELVKIDPKAIGVGQYQHDVHQPLLAAKLDEVVVSCVNRVGVELNTASAPLLTRVSGIGSSMAKKIVAFRDKNGAFQSRQELTKVPGLGAKTYEQAAGFLRIRGAANPLDSSGVHPERYALVEKMAKDLGVEVKALVGNAELADKIPLEKYVSADSSVNSSGVGLPTLKDIIAELKKPGRDPREHFEKPAFRDDVTELADVKEGMELEGIVTNVTAFGAFVDIGVHQDGLVHVSELSDHYVSDPASVVKTGDRIKVRVLSVDVARKRISLSARSQRPAGGGSAQSQGARGERRGGGGDQGGRGGFSGGRPVNRDRRDGGRRDRPPRDPKNPHSGGFNCNPFANLNF